MTLVEIQGMLNSPEKEKNDGKVLGQHIISFKQAILLKILFANKQKKVCKKTFSASKTIHYFFMPISSIVLYLVLQPLTRRNQK